MVHCDPLAGLLVLFKERKINDPKEFELVGNDAKTLCHSKSECSEGREHNAVFVGDNQNYVALLRAEFFVNRGKLVLGHELFERSVRLVNPSYISQTLCADALGVFGQLVDFFSCIYSGGVLGNDRPYRTAVFDRTGKHRKSAVLDQIGDILYLHIKADVGLVGAVVLHCVPIGHALKRSFKLPAQSLAEQIFKIALVDFEDILNINKRKLHIYLSKLRLTVGAQVLVAEAARKLDIAVKARNHQKLLVDLRRLRKRVELAVVDP